MEQPQEQQPAPRRDDVKVRGGASRCPYCHADVALDEAWDVCAGCLARHHPACWDEGGACSNCGGSERLSRAAGDAPPAAPRDPAPPSAKEDADPGENETTAEPGAESPLNDEDYEPLQVSPPQGFNPIFGTWGNEGYQILSEVDVAPQDVLLEVRGSDTARLTLLVLLAIGAPLLCMLPAAAEWVTQAIPAQFGVSPLAVIVAVAATGLLILGLLVANGASSLLGQGRAVFTEQGVLRDRPGGSVFVAWEEVSGYRASAEEFVALLGEPGILLSVPTKDEAARGEVLGLLDRRGVPRIS